MGTYVGHVQLGHCCRHLYVGTLDALDRVEGEIGREVVVLDLPHPDPSLDEQELFKLLQGPMCKHGPKGGAEQRIAKWRKRNKAARKARRAGR